MSGAVGEPQIGQWYERRDNADIFQVTGLDESAKTIEIQGCDGDIGELDERAWAGLPLVLAQPPDQWLESMDDTEAGDVVSSEVEMLLEDPTALERFAAAHE